MRACGVSMRSRDLLEFILFYFHYLLQKYGYALQNRIY